MSAYRSPRTAATTPAAAAPRRDPERLIAAPVADAEALCEVVGVEVGMVELLEGVDSRVG